MSQFALRVGFLGAALALLAAPAAAPAQQASFLGRSLPDWQKGLSQEDPVARRSAAYALGKMGSNALGAVADLLRRLEQDKNASVREAAACALGEISRESVAAASNPTLVPTLIAVLRTDADPLVKRSAAVALGNLGSDAAPGIGALEKALTDPAPEVKQNAAWALGKLKATGAVAGLRKAAVDTDPAVCRDAVNALGALKDAARPALPELLACCRHPDLEVKKSALSALVELVGPGDEKTAGQVLNQALNESDIEARRNAALALANIGGPDAAGAVSVLVEALINGDLELRRQAAAALKNIGPAAKDAVNALRVALLHSDQQLRHNAAVALGGLAKEAAPAVPELVKVVSNPREDVGVRIAVSVALSRIGPSPGDDAVVPTMLRILENPGNDLKPEERGLIRERSLWVLFPYALKRMETQAKIFPALMNILKERKTNEERMLRYHAAYILGGVQAEKCPPEALDVLLEFLHDPSILVYAGTGAKVSSTGAEKETGGANVKESGKGDGRVMAVRALRRVGPERVRQRPEIIAQLRTLVNDPATLADLRAQAKEALTELAP